ncbi:MAG: carboxypeptidase-like regulatory domain-containing protein [Bacteroidales bacterium]|nr:carboxypeptidase-like regulatory domain-containing protein [Bacteroidales bacterium]
MSHRHMKKSTLLLLMTLLAMFTASGQNPATLRGVVYDEKTNEPLPYANIIVLHKYIGTVSNESGDFYLKRSDLEVTDTISFQYIGYQTKKCIVGDLDSVFTVSLKEDLINLNETFIYGNPPNAKDIIKKVVENRDANYKTISSKNQVFIRKRDISDIEELSTDLKKNSISQLDEQMIQNALIKIPRNLTSYTDMLDELYFLSESTDSLKVKPLRTVSLKEIEIEELDQFGKIFENLFNETQEEEYWKVKTGILSQKLEIDNESVGDTAMENKPGKDSSYVKYYASSIKYWLKYTAINDTKEWEFLYDTRKYKYDLLGGSHVNGEDVYIIDFVPKSGGEYIGRAYISTTTYALVRADYEYAEGKTGRDFQLFGIGYSEDYFKASIYFEKQEDAYQLKYFSKVSGIRFSLNRNIALVKKQKRWLTDKTLNEIKVNLNLAVKAQASVEVLFLENQPISETQFNSYRQPKFMKVVYVDQFTDQLWDGYPIIEPTKQMREYKKQEFDW